MEGFRTNYLSKTKSLKMESKMLLRSQAKEKNPSKELLKTQKEGKDNKVL